MFGCQEIGNFQAKWVRGCINRAAAVTPNFWLNQLPQTPRLIQQDFFPNKSKITFPKYLFLSFCERGKGQSPQSCLRVSCVVIQGHLGSACPEVCSFFACLSTYSRRERRSVWGACWWLSAYPRWDLNPGPEADVLLPMCQLLIHWCAPTPERVPQGALLSLPGFPGLSLLPVALSSPEVSNRKPEPLV